MLRSILATFAVAALSSSALAADIYVAEPEVDYVVEKPVGPWAGYIEAYVGYMHQKFESDFFDEEFEEEEAMIGGAGRFAYSFNPGFSTQIDLWTEAQAIVDGDDDEDDVDSITGLAAHLTGHNGGMFFGGLGSLGFVADEDAIMGNVGLEAGVDVGNVRLYGQAGYTSAIQDDDDLNFIYAHGQATWYVNPNFLIAGDLGYYEAEEDDGDEADGLRWGATIEGKPEGSMLSYFARYQGGKIEWDDFAEEEEVEHIAQIGLKLNFGTQTLQDRDAQVGLVDFNPHYGANAVRGF